MRKKTLRVLLAAILVFMMSLNVVAANPSVSADGIVNEITAATDKNGNDISSLIEILDIREEDKAAAEEIKNIAKVKEVLGDAFVEGMEVVDVREVRAIGDVAFPVTLTFKVPGVVSTTKVAVLHYVEGAWKVEPSEAGNGTITATFESLSPVAFVVDKNTAVSATTSPKTGQNSTVAVAGIVVLAAAVGAFALRKRECAR